MEKMTHQSQVRAPVSVNASECLQTSAISGQATSRISLSANTTIGQAQQEHVGQVVFNGNAKVGDHGMQMKFLTNGIPSQPVIIGNVNSANFFNTTLTNRAVNSPLVLPAAPTAVNSNSLFGIVPVYIQQAGWLPSGTKIADNKNNTMILSSQDALSVCSTASGIQAGSNSLIQNQTLQPIQQPALSSSDTFILHRLSSQDTIKIPSQPSTTTITTTTTAVNAATSQPNVMQLQNVPSLGSAFSLISTISDRSLSLTNIPTVSLFSPKQTDNKYEPSPTVPFTSLTSDGEAESSDPSSGVPKSTSDLGTLSSQTYSVAEVQLQSMQEYEKRRKRKSESEPCQLQIDESFGGSVDQNVSDNVPLECRKKNLTRSDTVILDQEDCSKPTTSKGVEGNSSAVSASDTVILVDPENLERTPTRSSDGFNINSLQAQSSGSSVEAPGAIHLPSCLNSVVVPQDSGIRLMDSLQSMPSLVLTDSMVNGAYSTNLLCSLLSQTGNIQQAPFFTNVTLDQVDTENMTVLTELSPMQANGVLSAAQEGNTTEPPQGGHLALPEVFCTNNGSSTLPEGFCPADGSTVKGTQTEWILGNASVYFKPVKVEENLVTNSGKLTDGMGNVQNAVLFNGEGEDVINGPLILDDQAVPASVLNLIPPNINLIDSTAVSLHQSGDVCTTVAAGCQPDTSDPIFPCASCDQAFLSKSELEKHAKEHKKRILKCDLCTSTFTTMGNYTRHRKIHNLQPETQSVHKCEHCHRDFLQRCDLRRHMLIHTNQQPHRCDICGKGYIRRSDLVVHLRFHRKEKAFKCNLCDKSFFQSGDLSRHIRRAHEPNSQLTCGHCERKYACERTLIRHMKVVHKDIILLTVNKRLAGTD